MPQQDPNVQMLLNTILDQAKASSQRLDVVANEMVKKSDFQRVEDRLDSKLREMDDQFSEIRQQFQASDLVHKDLKAEIDTNSKFIREFSGGLKWFIRVVVVAALGVAGTVLPSYINTVNKPIPAISQQLPTVEISPSHHP